MCADAQKVDRAKLATTEFTICEFDADTFAILLDYLHTGSCPLTCHTIPGLICAAEHYDLPELLQACFHHAKQNLSPDVVCPMLVLLEAFYWRYSSASELVNMCVAYTEQHPMQIFTRPDFLAVNETMVQMMFQRELACSETRKFEAMIAWARGRVRHLEAAEAQKEYMVIFARLVRDLNLANISPQDLIKVVLPTKLVSNEMILHTLMEQANTGVFRLQQQYLEEFKMKMSVRKNSCEESLDVGLNTD